MTKSNEYIDLTYNGRFFPAWILKNFKQYKLPEIIRKDNEDPCNVQHKFELKNYQTFIGKYIGPYSQFDQILLYHGLGSGKTATAINLLNVFHNYDHNLVYVVLIKASLRDDPWMSELKIWLGRDKGEESYTINNVARFNAVHFVHYDSPFADKEFMNTLKSIDTTKQVIFIIDEAHNFIKNVLSNINSKFGVRAQTIYDQIMRFRRENNKTKLVLISGTPIVSNPFEVALIYNMLRPGIFPTSEVEFKRLFITDSMYPILQPQKKNLFERRILGLTSYYVGATVDTYARKNIEYVKLRMSALQYSVYYINEKKEAESAIKARKFGKISQLYRVYTRQSGNFVFPNIDSKYNGLTRPRPSHKISVELDEKIQAGKIEKITVTEDITKYINELNKFIDKTEQYFMSIKNRDADRGHTIFDDMKLFKEEMKTIPKYSFKKFYNNVLEKKSSSELFLELYNSSPKMTCILFLMSISPGKIVIYSNYVIMEGLDMMKLYLKLVGYGHYSDAKPFLGYCEFHGRISKEDKTISKTVYNDVNNIDGNKCNVILLSPSGSEGINLKNVRQMHIMEPHWNEARIEQIIGRGVRQCSHKDLPLNERNVDIYRYKIIKPHELEPSDTMRQTTDEYIEDRAKAADNLNQSFLIAMKESAVDCYLFKTHNSLTESYTCFRFPDDVMFDKMIGPAYHENIKEDVKYNSGLHAPNTNVEQIKVIKIKGTYATGETYVPEEFYWYYPKTHIVYDYEMHYPVGRVLVVDDIPQKLTKDVYVLTDVIHIPQIL